MNYQYIKSFEDNEELLNSYFNLTQRIFWFDLIDWRRAGFWKDKYIPHSLMIDNQIVANVSAAIMHVQVNGKDIDAVQLGSVGVLPEYRGMGLARILMEKVMEEYKTASLVFLFASDDVSQFYTKFGLKRYNESFPFIDINENINKKEVKKLSLNSPVLKNFLSKDVHLQRSSIIDARENSDIYWFHLMYNHIDNIYFIEEKNIIFLASYEDNEVHLYDVMTENEVDFQDIKNYVLKEDTKKVWFHFTPDWLIPDYRVIPWEDNALYVCGEFLKDMSNCRFPTVGTT